MIRVTCADPGRVDTPRQARRRRFGLDTPLPADVHVIERAILRHLAARHPETLVLVLAHAEGGDPAKTAGRISLAAGVPGLMLLLPGGRAAFLVVKTQARTLTRAERCFADLCRLLTIPVHVVRSLPEARLAFDSLGLAPRSEISNEAHQSRVSGRTP